MVASGLMNALGIFVRKARVASDLRAQAEVASARRTDKTDAFSEVGKGNAIIH